MISFADVLGGAERSLLTLAKLLPARGWMPVLVCPPGGLADAAARQGLDVERVVLRRAGPVSRRSGSHKTYSAKATLVRSWATVDNAARIARVARRRGPALLHSNSLPSHLPVALAGRLVRRPVVWHLREMITPGPGRTFFSRFGRLAAGMVAISDAVAATVTHPSVSTVYNPVEAPTGDIREQPWHLPRPLVGYLGRLDPRKGIEDLIEAAGATEAHVVVAGRPSPRNPGYLASLERLAAARAPGRIHFVGELEAPWQLLAAVDVLVVPSLAEPFGRVAAEGQVAGVPVLAADAGGLPEIVRDGHDGLLFPPADSASLATCLHRVLADETLRHRLADAGRTSSARFEPAKHADVMAQIFTRHAGTAVTLDKEAPRASSHRRGSGDESCE